MATNEPRWADRADGSTWISHWTIKASDLERLRGATHLTLWNVKFPSGFQFRSLPLLEFLDIRGGSKADLSELEACEHLQGLVVNQVRGLCDIGTLSEMDSLRILSLYGLAKVERLPDMSRLTHLERLDIGQMRNLTEWAGLVTPPNLREVFFHNLLRPDLKILDQLASHPRLESFNWIAPDVPAKTQDPVHQRFVTLGKARPVRPEEWLAEAHER
jgi:hypothetical protein